MRRRNLMRARVYRKDATGKRIPSTFNQKVQKIPTAIVNTNMSCASNKFCKENKSSDLSVESLYDVSIKCCNLNNLMNAIPVNSSFDNGIVKDFYIKKVYYMNAANNILDSLCNLTNVEALTYTKWYTVTLVVKLQSNIPATATITSGDYTFTHQGNKTATNTCKKRRAPFRLPIKGYRKELKSCALDFNDGKNIYMDNYAKAKKGSGCKYDCNGKAIGTVFSRTNYPVIRSGMLDNNDGTSFRSYRDYLRNGTMSSYDRSLEKNRKDKDDCRCYYKSSDGKRRYNDENCTNKKDCANNKVEMRTIYKPSNNKFKVQGAVSSGSRIDRLKLDTITGVNNSCKNIGTNKCKNQYGCEPYFAGKPRFTGWIYNKKNPEVVNYDKRQRPLGVPQNQKYRIPGNVACKSCNHASRVEGGCCKK